MQYTTVQTHHVNRVTGDVRTVRRVRMTGGSIEPLGWGTLVEATFDATSEDPDTMITFVIWLEATRGGIAEVRVKTVDLLVAVNRGYEALVLFLREGYKMATGDSLNPLASDPANTAKQ